MNSQVFRAHKEMHRNSQFLTSAPSGGVDCCRMKLSSLIGIQRPPLLITHVKEATVIIIVLAVLFGLWFGVSTHHPRRASYPYYDTQKPVPPWSEPEPLESNRNTGGD